MEEGGPIILFDGICNLCNRSVKLVLQKDVAGRFRFASFQGIFGKNVAQQFGIDTSQLSSFALYQQGNLLTNSAAALEVARHLQGWQWLYWFKIIPSFLRDAVYTIIARNRYRWFGKADACLLPRPEWKHRFID